MHDQLGGWFTGPAADRFRYNVSSAVPLAGGQGFVFKAHRTDHRPEVGARDVALKLVGDAPADAERRLRDRWERVEQHPHPRVARVIEVFRGPGLFDGSDAPPDEDSDLLYLATHWVEGVALRATAPCDRVTAATVVQDLAEGLEHLHTTCRLVHRDVHPGNVIVGPDGRGTLIDLGAARPDDGIATGTVAGVIGFIPPERTYGPGDRRSDGWALAMVAAYALVGHPVGGMSSQELERSLVPAVPHNRRRRHVVGLLLQGLAADPADRPADIVQWAAELRESLGDGVARRRRPRAVAAVAAALVLVAGGVTAGLADDDQHGGTPGKTTSTTTGKLAASEEAACPAEVGAVASDALEADAEQIRGALPALRAAVGDACVIEPAATFAEAVYQRIQRGSATALVFHSPVGTVTLTDAEWRSYTEIAGRQQSLNSVTFGGYPLRVDRAPIDVETYLELSLGGVLIGRRADTQSFWMPRPVLDLWLQHGGVDGDLGLPMTNPFVAGTALRQDFEHGHLELPGDITLPLASITSDSLVLHPAIDEGAELAGIDLTNGIVRQPQGSAWWVDGDGVRHWIRDGSTYECLGGDPLILANDVSGAAIATLPLGGPASCEDAP